MLALGQASCQLNVLATKVLIIAKGQQSTIMLAARMTVMGFVVVDIILITKIAMRVIIMINLYLVQKKMCISWWNSQCHTKSGHQSGSITPAVLRPPKHGEMEGL